MKKPKQVTLFKTDSEQLTKENFSKNFILSKMFRCCSIKRKKAWAM